MTDTNTAEREALMDLIDAYAEARHVGGCHTYNAKTAEARAKVVASLAAGQSPFEECYVCGRPMDGLSEDDCHCFHRKELRASLAASAGGEPWGAFCGGRVWVGRLPAHVPKMGLPIQLLYTHPSPPEGMAGWISVEDRLPEWAARDDTPCFINGKEVPPTLTSETVLVALKGGGVRTDKLTTIEGKSDGWWHTYGERVVAWQKTPPLPASEAKEL